ncbi:EF-hand domain-containing protein [Pseudoroseomonas ludipueritiae]|uniref:EF-hand domain-containing protein n=1 Tax=Pseudoroseomonas ludipueritiae TaxID=198093 RepID=A0ABR7RAU7_9PROT|nr:EF-hand domain-containing protein [Pseudoroseomonas ludipueritiae]MBC9178954.1 EF-hand domain-containing protein [Pseudoroseomonas ludipueritiae]MCG7363653.1 EF-hand domain-containing protein [Roseomonas sp. ACRSG]
MKRSLAFGFLGVALAATALPALAQRGPGSIPMRIFEQADANHDGRVAEPEAMDFLAARFTEADANHDGAMTPEELGNFLRAQMASYRPGTDSGRERRQPPPEAQRRMEERQARFFRIADADRDGRITMDELRPMAAALFRAADANGDNVLEPGELRGHRGPRGEHRGPARGDTRPL